MSPLTRPCLYTSWLWSQHLTYQIVHIPHYDKHPVSYAQAGLRAWRLGSWCAGLLSILARVVPNYNPHFSINEMSYEPFLCYKLCWNVLLFLCNICCLRLLPLLIYITLTHTSSDARLPKSGIFPPKSERSHLDATSLLPQSILNRIMAIYILQCQPQLLNYPVGLFYARNAFSSLIRWF